MRTAVAAFAAGLGDERWCVALSGGADSLSLTAAAAALRPTTALIVDHQLQPDSASVAASAREQALSLGCIDAQVIPVQVGTTGGPEAAARTARYQALDTARAGAPVLLGHTLDDQAETVLLGLGRGSGPRSIAGMRPHDPPWCRPLLGVRRAVTVAACAELEVTPWQDPHNTDRRFTRVRLRNEVLPLLEDVLGGGVAEALARTAAALRADTDTLDDLAGQSLAGLRVAGALTVAGLEAMPEALRRRVIRRWLLDGGAAGLTDKQIRAVDALVVSWRGQGGVAVGSPLRDQRLFAGRRGGMLTLHTEPVGNMKNCARA
ncbi:tRNA(Ile)-lysidine synthase [Mycolicibacterium rutilum]|uniref:tRNA(Ile)-lysidine synthase n=1 Tax=Mycolicibacterium rutilum TaxID=370526 RepID=A0A1H6JFS0_MYCRU|nr:tRNA(Ile)-lysidine synthase [Mycolicibacterium rutilum]